MSESKTPRTAAKGEMARAETEREASIAQRALPIAQEAAVRRRGVNPRRLEIQNLPIGAAVN